jgi:hypothetical protein
MENPVGAKVYSKFETISNSKKSESSKQRVCGEEREPENVHRGGTEDTEKRK